MKNGKVFYSGFYNDVVDFQQMMALAKTHFRANGQPFLEEAYLEDMATFHHHIFDNAIAVQIFIATVLEISEADVSIEITLTDSELTYEITGVTFAISKHQLAIIRAFFAALLRNDEFISLEQDDSGVILFSLYSDSFDRYIIK